MTPCRFTASADQATQACDCNKKQGQNGAADEI